MTVDIFTGGSTSPETKSSHMHELIINQHKKSVSFAKDLIN